MLIDTHAHLDFPDFVQDLPEVLSRASAAGVHRIVTISTTVEGCRRALDLAEQHANIFATVGVHPSQAAEAPEDVFASLREFVLHPRVVAIGECGLDYHRLPSSRMHEAAVATAAFGNETPADVEASILDGALKARQAEVFQQQLDLAAEYALPVVVHERDAWEDTLALLAPYTGKVRAVFHCFGKSIEHAQQVLAMGHLVSFTGIVTFKKAEIVQDTVAQLPAGTFMVETDCPYLAPAPHRGKRCEPAHTRDTAVQVAQLRGVPLEQIAAETTATAEAFFRFPGQG
jgi:TatD DNase family protein